MRNLSAKFKNFMATLLVVVIYLAILALLLICVSVASESIDAFISHKRIEKYYSSTDDNYIFVDSKDREVPAFVTGAFDKLPKEISDMIKKDWYIVISEKDPMNIVDSHYVAGATYYRAKMIWLIPDFTEHHLLHEIGHAFADTRNYDKSSEFCALHSRSLDTYLEINDECYDTYSASTPVEFFAFLFDQYFTEPENLKSNLVEGYCYVSDLAGGYKKTFMGTLSSHLVKIYNGITYKTKGILNIGRGSIGAFAVENEVKNQPYINIENYTFVESFAGLNEAEREMVYQVLDIIEHPENYQTQIHFKRTAIAKEYDFFINGTTYNKIAACVDFYYGRETSNVFDITADHSNNCASLYVYTDTAEQLKKDRHIYIEKIEEVISTLHEGTETQKLLQICKYITDNCEYKIKETTSCKDFFETKTGDCVTYAMVFRLFCERLGIQCDVYFGSNLTNANHVWNRVKLSDGSYRYYDLTYYDKGMIDMSMYDACLSLAVNAYLD